MRAEISAGTKGSGVASLYRSLNRYPAIKKNPSGPLRLRVILSGQLRFFSVFFCCLIQVFPPNAAAQPFPVTSIVQATGFSPYPEDYADPGRLVITLISTDIREEYPALIRIRFSGNGFQIRTREDYLPAPVILHRNQPLVLTGPQLAGYFHPDNLEFSGLTPGDLPARWGQLPEGPVALCVEVYDYQRFFDPPVSNTGCAQGIILLHRPPVLLEPVGQVPVSVPQQLRFVWQPQHAGIAAEYTLELYENQLTGFGYDATLNASAPVFSTRTFSPFYLYGPADPALNPGQEYLVRIRAEDPSGRSAFINGGWSEVYAFTLENAVECLPPDNLNWTVNGPQSALLTWTPAPGARKQWISRDSVAVFTGGRNSLAIGVELAADAGSYAVDSLVQGTAYAFRVCSACADGTIVCSDITFVFPNNQIPDCLPDQPLNLMVERAGARSADLQWVMAPGDSVAVSWKPIGEPAAEQVLAVKSDRVKLLDLMPSTDYRVRVCFICPSGFATCDSIDLRTLKPGCEVGPVEYGYACGDSTGTAFPDDAPLLTAVAPGDSVWAGDYLVIVKQVTGAGSFYGEGYIEVPYFNMAHVAVKLVGIQVNEHCRMSAGHMEVTGAGLDLIGDQWAGVLTDVLNTLSTLEEILGATEEILGAVNEILIEMGPNLPDSVSQDLQDAQSALLAAQQQYDAAVASGDSTAIAQAAQALQQAVEQVKAANQAFQEALDQIMSDLLGIVTQAIDGITVACPEQSGLETGFNAAVAEIDHYLQQQWSGVEALGGDGVDDFNALQQFVSDTDADSTSFSPELTELSNGYYQVEEQYMTCTAFGKLKVEVVDAASLTALAQVLLETGFNLVDFAAPLLLSGQPVEAIVTAVGEELKRRVSGVLVGMGYD
ncbi:MAG: fibronectin type III domain-containing protein [Lewinellaceae bacterium]|nr:fibronectin type III domain-containing protein [Lewinella sp.]MCB9282001.1 fibronectin type III domain-containing protein [Lewinellaceae bacterium]